MTKFLVVPDDKDSVYLRNTYKEAQDKASELLLGREIRLVSGLKNVRLPPKAKVVHIVDIEYGDEV